MKIVIATGGSGGHIFPAFETADELRRQGQEVIFAGVWGSWREKIAQKGYPFFEISAQGLTRGPGKGWVVFLRKLIKSIGESKKILSQLKPDAVIGFGGYGSFPLVFVASLRGIPTLIHEQNVVPGRANQWLAFFAWRIAVSFSATREYFPRKKTVLTGCPIRKMAGDYNREKILEEFHLQPGKYTILVIGGSQGSRRINQIFLQTVRLLNGNVKFQVIHAAGQQDFERAREEYREMGIQAHVAPFLNEMDQAYAVADLAITRAGAMTITELARWGLPVILIPYPFARSHQNYNAQELCRTIAADMMEETACTAELLKQRILSIKERCWDRELVRKERQPLYNPDAASRIVEETLSLC